MHSNALCQVDVKKVYFFAYAASVWCWKILLSLLVHLTLNVEHTSSLQNKILHLKTDLLKSAIRKDFIFL